MKPSNLLFLGTFAFLSLLPLSAQREFPQALGLNGGLTSGTGFTYRYLNDWGWQVTGLAISAPVPADQKPVEAYFVGASLLKELYFYASKDKNFHTILYGLWGSTLWAGSSNSQDFFLNITTGPGFGFEVGILQHLAIYTEVSQGITFNVIKKPEQYSVDAGPVYGGGIIYKF